MRFFVTYIYQWQQLVERFFDINMTKSGISYFLTVDAKDVHCAICAFDKINMPGFLRSGHIQKLKSAITLILRWESKFYAIK